ncbi:MAG: M48 family metalloprotease [Chitinivibrionales bacterium]|nr:M48 family metalloprotease [Chitinivibrionales bacterium]
MSIGKWINKELLFLLAFIIVTAGTAYLIAKYVPKKMEDSGKTIEEISVEWEKKFKESVKSYIAEDSKIVTDKELIGMLETISDRLLDKIDKNPYDVEILLVQSDVVNAFAFPGGLIVIYTPLIRTCDSPEQLAAVIAHEMGHVIHRDPLRRLIQQFGVSVLLSMIGSGESVAYLESIIKNVINMKYSRGQEDKADDFALALLDSCLIDPMHFADFMQKIAVDKKSTNFARWFMTHPDTQSRIDKAMEKSDEFNNVEDRFTIDWENVRQQLPSVFD